MKNRKEEKGITLVALVITIIVLLILAGITISLVVGDNGIIGKGKQAKENMTNAQGEENEQLKNLQNYIEEIGGTTTAPEETDPMPEGEKFSQIKTANETVTTGGKTAVVPKGFAVGTSNTINTIENGLVITDKVDKWGNSIGNQFVWIPVESEAEFARIEWANNAPTEGFNNNYIEPTSFIETGEKAEYTEMRTSVLANKGFYVGRYEAGCEIQRTSSNKTTAQTVLIQKDKYVYNYVPWGASMTSVEDSSGVKGAVKLSREMYPEGNTNYGVTSTLMYGVQWDSMLKFIADETHNVTDSRSWGNYYDSTGEAATNSRSLQTTGKNEAWKAKNIYDIAGNAFEWTMETDYTYGRNLRGGYYDDLGINFPVSYRLGGSADVSDHDSYTFRPVLYVNS